MSESQTSALTSKYRGKTVLAFGAHPDDLELGAGGTLSRLSEEGSKVVMIVVCSPNHLASRKAESEKAAKILGASEIRFLYDQKEQRVEDLKNYELVAHMDKLVREFDPELIISHAKSNFHRDHVLVHEATVQAQRLHFFDFLAFYPTSCHPVTTPFHPQVYVDITKHIDRKMDAIHQHTTQFACRGLTTDHYRGVAAEYGRLAGTEFAEGLEAVRLRLA